MRCLLFLSPLSSLTSFPRMSSACWGLSLLLCAVATCLTSSTFELHFTGLSQSLYKGTDLLTSPSLDLAGRMFPPYNETLTVSLARPVSEWFQAWWAILVSMRNTDHSSRQLHVILNSTHWTVIKQYKHCLGERLDAVILTQGSGIWKQRWLTRGFWDLILIELQNWTGQECQWKAKCL